MKNFLLPLACFAVLSIFFLGHLIPAKRIVGASSADIGQSVSFQGKVISQKGNWLFVCAKNCVNVIAFNQKDLSGKSVVIEGRLEAGLVLLAKNVEVS